MELTLKLTDDDILKQIVDADPPARPPRGKQLALPDNRSIIEIIDASHGIDDALVRGGGFNYGDLPALNKVLATMAGEPPTQLETEYMVKGLWESKLQHKDDILADQAGAIRQVVREVYDTRVSLPVLIVAIAQCRGGRFPTHLADICLDVQAKVCQAQALAVEVEELHKRREAAKDAARAAQLYAEQRDKEWRHKQSEWATEKQLDDVLLAERTLCRLTHQPYPDDNLREAFVKWNQSIDYFEFRYAWANAMIRYFLALKDVETPTRDGSISNQYRYSSVYNSIRQCNSPTKAHGIVDAELAKLKLC